MCSLSIIVAIYKVEKYLPECLESIIPQLTPETELILVDDGSPDNCGRICDEYAAKNPDLIRVIHQENAGVSVARNTGMDNAHGEWITFADGDDMLTSDAIETMLAYAAGETADVVVFGHIKMLHGTYASVTDLKWNEMRLIGSNEIRAFRYSIFSMQKDSNLPYDDIYIVAPWAKLLRRSFLAEKILRFVPGVKRGQDEVFTLSYTGFLNEIHIVPKAVYCYRLNEGSISVRFSADALDFITRLMDENSVIVSRSGDPGLEAQFYLFCYRHIKQALRLGAYHRDCPWTRKERIAWLKELCGKDWVDRSKSLVSAETNIYWKKIISSLVSCNTQADFAYADFVIYWHLRTRPAIGRSAVGKFLKRLLKKRK